MIIDPYGRLTFDVTSTTKTLFPVGKGAFEYANSIYYDDQALDADVLRLANAIIRYENQRLLQQAVSGVSRKPYPYIPDSRERAARAQ